MFSAPKRGPGSLQSYRSGQSAGSSGPDSAWACGAPGGEGDGQREEDPAAAVCHWDLPPARWGIHRTHRYVIPALLVPLGGGEDSSKQGQDLMSSWKQVSGKLSLVASEGPASGRG